MHPQKFRAVLGCLAAVLAVACSKSEPSAQAPQSAQAPSAAASGAAPRKNLTIAVVTHGQASDTFWSVVKNGVNNAAQDSGVTVTYNAPQTFDMVAMSRLIDAEVAKKPDGLVVSIPDAEALSRSIRAAVDAGIPVISINSGADVYKGLGVLLHVGQTEYEAGVGGGEKMAATGVKNVLCVNHEVGNASLDLRCKGFLDAVAKAGGTGRVLSVNAADPTDSQQKVSAALTGGVDGILTLGPLSSNAALAALRQGGSLGKVKLGTFDLTPDVLSGIQGGELEFAIDQQQYLQGYLPIVLLSQYKQFGVLPAGGVLPTGPGFVTRETASRVIELSKQGIR
ncbi:monosaccharide ABC transporter substrate-binding protein, CUT2 family [Stigmatella aurantiaca]|uniref:Monosaccharide ABC transporter substrate-binding protein, CUT2 family n=1 Tax=Stigmatella aurantiaca TaxID=41 RepID=A0A1H7MN86_STIAU|nr:sugar ABC transporter substrate-binding protein [Stigmatella aurantiaca]SEL12077.1 monosaccharide ABC transporter substrate-binding protein, CUT2 family [Stigmatella aurantiaca]